MTVLIFAVEVEDDQEIPEVGTYFDVVNSTWTWLDARFAGTLEEFPTADSKIRRII